MKNTILALALTAAAVPFTFAAQTAASTANPSAQTSATPAAKSSVKTTKKSHKKAVKKNAVKSDSGVAPSGSAAGSAPVKK